MEQAQLMFGDANGDSIIFEGEKILKKEKYYQIVTNFYQSNPEIGGYPCPRYKRATEMGCNCSIIPNL